MPANNFFICRPPGLEIRGYIGTYINATAPLLGAADTVVYIQPWDKKSKLQQLEILQTSYDTDQMSDWCNIEIPTIEEDTICISQEGFTRYVQKVLQAIAQGKMLKTVTARKKIIARNTKPIFNTFQDICKAYPSAFVYALFHPDFGFWIGASPEILLKGTGDSYETVALAGTLIHADSRWTEKEIREQSITSEFIENKLSEFHVQDLIKKTTETTSAGPLKHLFAQYQFKLQENIAPLLLEALHPTPAVGGFPQKEAVDFIATNENLDRALYAGWVGLSENGTFLSQVNLRCAKLFNDCAELYAGCGINIGSEPTLEWIETEAKMEVIGKFIGK